jgi:hypothetical protein
MQVGMGSMDHYERDFEEVLLHDTASYYKRKAAEWINEDSCPEYMLKVGGKISSDYLRMSSVGRLHVALNTNTRQHQLCCTSVRRHRHHMTW